MKKNDIIANSNKYILNTYTRLPVVFVKGKGVQLTDIDGKKYLDFISGWGVSNVGHCHPKVVSAIRDQIAKLLHIPNNLYIIPQIKLAKEVVRLAYKGKVFFCNSGAEANEAAIKFARAYGHDSGRYEIITTLKSFHGRTFGSMSATGQQKIQKQFVPIVDGFKYVPFNDIAALKKAITKKTIAIMIEPVQGEGGVNIASQEYVEAIRELCDDNDLLFIADEVQTGFGRTGKMFAFQHYGIKPDLMTMAKGLGGGVPIGMMLAKIGIADTFKPGMHGSTYAGNPLVTKAALGNIEAIQKYKMLSNTQKMGKILTFRLEELKNKYDVIKEVRSIGLMIGVEFNQDVSVMVQKCLDKGLLVNVTQGNVLRLLPPMIITEKHINRAVSIIDSVIQEISHG